MLADALRTTPPRTGNDSGPRAGRSRCPRRPRVYDYRHDPAEPAARAACGVFTRLGRQAARLRRELRQARAADASSTACGTRAREILARLSSDGTGDAPLHSTRPRPQPHRGRRGLPLRAGAVLNGQPVRSEERDGRAAARASPAAIRRVFWKPLRNDYG